MSPAKTFRAAWDWFTGASSEYTEFVQIVERLEAANSNLRFELSEALRWKRAVEDALAANWGLNSNLENDPERAVHALIATETALALDPEVSERAAALRDSWPVLRLEIERKEVEAYQGRPDALTATKLFDAGFPVDLRSGAPLFGHLTVQVTPITNTTIYTWRRK
jgi:hypothetical protein